MIVVNINHKDYKLLWHDLAATLGIPCNGADFIMLPPASGKGCIKHCAFSTNYR